STGKPGQTFCTACPPPRPTRHRLPEKKTAWADNSDQAKSSHGKFSSGSEKPGPSFTSSKFKRRLAPALKQLRPA
ncbi:hypothetical protein, partial [Geoalkalibacter sp.]|uniref:hypothetical protein n=1 Tax=Geoalkalibacter sp. TaxID=3041440 RepID=UPI00272E1F43